MMNIGKLALAIGLLGSHWVFSQNLQFNRVEIADNKVVVHYDLQDEKTERTYLVNLFSSQDNFTKELTKVSGDVGTEVKPGMDKKIVWDITKELGSYKGDMTFEVRGRIYVPFVKLNELEAGKIFKRGKSYPLTWTSGNLSGQVNIELYKGTTRISGDNNQPNVGKFDWSVPGNAKSGNDYQLRFTNTKDRNDVVYSQPITIKPKIPLAVKALGVVAVGGLIFILSSNKTTPNTTVNQEKVPGLVSPPGTPDGN